MRLDSFLDKYKDRNITVVLHPAKDIMVEGVSAGKAPERVIEFTAQGSVVKSQDVTWKGTLIEGEVIEETRPPRKR